jgi:hypothetical protein
MTIRLHVERLALEGLAVAGGDRARLERAVVGELTRLLDGGDSAARATGAFGAGGAIAGLRGADVQMQPGGTMAGLGAEVARAVFGALVPVAGADVVPGITRSGVPQAPVLRSIR